MEERLLVALKSACHSATSRLTRAGHASMDCLACAGSDAPETRLVDHCAAEPDGLVDVLALRLDQILSFDGWRAFHCSVDGVFGEEEAVVGSWSIDH